MHVYRQIHTSIWKKPWVLDLEPDEKLLFIYLFSNEQTNLTGLYEMPLRVMAFETGIDKGRIVQILAKFDKLDKVHYDADLSLVWVVNLFEYNALNSTSPKIYPHVVSSFANMPDCELRTLAIGHYNGMVGQEYRIDTLCIPHHKHSIATAVGTASEQVEVQQAEADESEPEEEPAKTGFCLPASSTDALALLLALPMEEPNASKVASAGLDYVRGWLSEFDRRAKNGRPVHNPPGLLFSMWEAGKWPDKPPGNGRDKRSIDGAYGEAVLR